MVQGLFRFDINMNDVCQVPLLAETVIVTMSSITTGIISNSTIDGNIITPSATENDTCQTYHAVSAEAKGQIDNLVKMLHDMENKK